MDHFFIELIIIYYYLFECRLDLHLPSLLDYKLCEGCLTCHCIPNIHLSDWHIIEAQ